MSSADKGDGVTPDQHHLIQNLGLHFSAQDMRKEKKGGDGTGIFVKATSLHEDY